MIFSTDILSIIFVLFGQALNASIVLIDKYVVTKTNISHPRVYAFYVGMVSSVVIVLLPFGVIGKPDLYLLGLCAFAGLVFITSIVFLFSALKHANATDVVSWLAAVSTLTTFILGYAFLEESLPSSFPIALALFLVGMFFVGHFRFYARSFVFVVFAGILFGVSAILMKLVFEYTTFANGFFWSRMGNVLGALSLLLVPEVRRAISHASHHVSHKTTSLIVVNRIFSGVAILSILYATNLGSVSIVNALSSLQFVFVFLLIYLLRNRLSHLYEHEFRPGHILHKLMAMLFIIAGFFVLFL